MDFHMGLRRNWFPKIRLPRSTFCNLLLVVIWCLCFCFSFFVLIEGNFIRHYFSLHFHPREFHMGVSWTVLMKQQFHKMKGFRLFHFISSSKFCTPRNSAAEEDLWHFISKKKMPNQLLHISDVTPQTRKWSVKVVVDQKQMLRQSLVSSKRYQRLVLIDEEGTKIGAVIFEDDIALFEKTLKVYETYTISNAKVGVTDTRYRASEHQFQWIINRATNVKFESHNAIPRSIFKPIFTSFTDFHNFMGTKETIDIIGMIIEKLPQRAILIQGKHHTVKDFAIINNEMLPCVLTLWNDLAKHEGEIIENSIDNMPILIATNLIVSAYNGLSLGSTNSTTIILNPSTPDAQNLKAWAITNQTQLKDIIEVGNYRTKGMLESNFRNEDETMIANAVKDDTIQQFTVKIRAQILDNTQKYYYVGCNRCGLGMRAECEAEIECIRCTKTTVAKLRERLSLNIWDASGDLNITAFGDMAARLLPANVYSSIDKETGDLTEYIDEINEYLKQKTMLMRLSKKIQHRYNGIHVQYSLINFKEAEIETQTMDEISTTPQDYTQDKTHFSSSQTGASTSTSG